MVWIQFNEMCGFPKSGEFKPDWGFCGVWHRMDSNILLTFKIITFYENR